MNLDAFFCITLSTIVLFAWWKYHKPDPEPPKKSPPTKITMKNDPVDTKLRENKESERQRERDIADLRKQGYSDEIIATILPIVKDD